MKKLYTTLVTVFAITQFSYAQWATGTGTIYPTTLTDKVSIGTSFPTENLTIGTTISSTDLTFGLRAINANSASTRSIFTQGANTGALTLSVDQGQNGTAGAFALNVGPSANALYVGSSGKVGIGTTTPLQSLQVNGNVSASAAANATNAYFMFQRSSDGYTGARIGNAYEFSNYKGALVFETNNGNGPSSLTEAMRINSLGYVGIGTINPIAKGHITGNPSLNTASTTDILVLERPFNPGVAFGRMASIALGSADALSNGSGRIDFNVNPSNSSLGPNPSSIPALTTVMSILGNGNVGISTTDPSFGGSLNSKFSIAQTDASTGLTVGNTSGVPRFALNGFNDGSWTMYDYAAGSWTQGITQKQGNVGIGTNDSKGYKLAVNGSVIATSVTVKLYSNWPDFVFEEKYQLRPITEIDAYIKQNRHLPDVPTAAEVEKNGVNLGGISSLLLKKIEELTLYLIDKDKQLKEQQDKIAALEAQRKEIDELKAQMAKLLK
jgi:hypothetical protein